MSAHFPISRFQPTWLGTLALLLVTGLVPAPTQASDMADAARWQREAQAVTITRDDWGIAHVHGKTDAEAVFGMAYAQAEDDFNRVETNYPMSRHRAETGGAATPRRHAAAKTRSGNVAK